MPLYADVVLPLAHGVFTYAVDPALKVVRGDAVAVPLGARGERGGQFYTGIVWRLHDQRPDAKSIRTICRRIYDRPLLPEAQCRLWEWMAEYYFCTLGEVMRAALPALLKPRAESREAFDAGEYRPRTESYYLTDGRLSDEEYLNTVFEKLERRAPRQYEALLEIVAMPPQRRTAAGEVPRRLLQADAAVLAALVKKGLLHRIDQPRTIEGRSAEAFRLPELTPMQTKADDDITEAFRTKTCTLLHGITGSGKTEIYIRRIAEVLARGGDVLMLVPEIALTAQLIDRLERTFGSRVTAYHSKLSGNRRTETFLRLNRSEGGELVVGARSALFLPLAHLQLIIVDEEHDAGYKQEDTAPRYQARDSAVVLAQAAGARVLLGSATPSLESWLNAQTGKYGLACLTERYGGSVPPRILLSDTLRAVKRGERRTHFNADLVDRLREVLAAGGQAMLFQNRRGFSPFVRCTECGWTARCPQCNVSLTWHKASDRLVCHYCGHTERFSEQCPHCHRPSVGPAGFGTEKVGEEIARLLPEARVARMDRDTATSERVYRAIIEDFETGRSNVLVGTQMITKGFDFAGVALVGILNADNFINLPDFRAAERAFQLITQVAGRAGRRREQGEVIIQTAEPDHPLLQQAAAGDYGAMARRELAERRAFTYPPYARLIQFTLRHADPVLLRSAAQALAEALRERFRSRVLGPTPPPVDRIRGEYLLTLLLKIESGASMRRARELVREAVDRSVACGRFKPVALSINVDPL